MKTKLLSTFLAFFSVCLMAQQELSYIPLNSNELKQYNSIETLISEEFPNDLSKYQPNLVERSSNNGCPTGDVIITSQSEINALLGCTEIPGDLVITGTNIIDGDSTITDLSPLNDLTNIAGDILIGGLPEITTLPTFESLTNINGDYRIFSMPLLTSLPNVPNQTTLTGAIQFSLLPQVTTLPAGLSNIVSTTSSISINNLSGINIIPSLNNLQTVGDFLAFGNLPINDLPNLENLNSVGGFLNVIGLSQITQINLPSLVSVGDALNTQNNSSLTSINAPLLQTAGQILIAGNPSMTEISGFPSLTEIISRLGIALQNNITNVSAFSNLQTVGFFLLQSTNFTNVDFLSNVTGMTTGFQIVVNPDLTNLNGLNNIEIIEGQVTNFDKIIAISSCPNLAGLGSVDLTSNNHFVTISIQGPPVGTQNLVDLSALSGITGDLDVISLRFLAITDLNFLSNLNKVTTNLVISNNNSLNNINGLAGIDVSDLDTFTITSNPLLDDCVVAAVCTAINLNNLNGLPAVNIDNNNTNCIDIGTVEIACQALSVDDFNDFVADIYPNPFIDEIKISLPSGIFNAVVNFINVEGKIMMSQNIDESNHTIRNLQSLTNGLYLLQITLENGNQIVQKVIK